MKSGRNAKLLAFQITSDSESAKLRRGRVIGMTFQSGAEFEELCARQRALGQLVERMHDAESHRDAAPQAAGRWNIACDRNRKLEWSDRRSFKKSLAGFAHHRREASGATSNDGYIVVKLKRNAEAVEARTQIRGAGRDANSDGGLHEWKITVTR